MKVEAGQVVSPAQGTQPFNPNSGDQYPYTAEALRLQEEGWVKCRNPRCDYWLDPEEFDEVAHGDGQFVCPRCHMSYPFLDVAPFGNLDQGAGAASGSGIDERYDDWHDRDRTIVGLPPKDMGDIGENLLKSLGELPEYGEFTWFASNEAYNDPIDAGIGEWAVEIKTLCIDAKNQRFVIGEQHRREAVIQRAIELGFTAILGVLVVADFRTSVADIYAREMDLGEWKTKGNRPVRGPVNFKKDTAPRLLTQVPFENPFLDPNSPAPDVMTIAGEPESEIPF
jgi:hypothetical protein